MLKKVLQFICTGLMLALFGGCALGPKYQKPEAQVPIQYKHDAPWKKATPSDHLAKGNWWEIYADATLNRLEIQAGESNQTLKAAYARLTQALAAAGISEADRMPRLDLNASASRQRSAVASAAGIKL
jgi:multidrug efflux system outer membrane protein